MFSQKVAVHYLDGTTRDTTLTQYSMGQFAVHAQVSGWSVDVNNPGLLGVVMLRYQAWVELHRDPGSPRPAFTAWDQSVIEVEPVEDPVAADPTQPAT